MRDSFFVMAAALAAGVGTPAMAQEGDLEERLSRIEAGINALKADSGDGWLTQRRAEEVRAIALDVLHDADTRLSQAMVELPSLQVTIEAKFLLVSDHFLEDVGIDFDDDDHRTGFETPLTRLTFRGEANGAEFALQGAVRKDEQMTLLDAWIGRWFGENVFVQAGQFKPPFALEAAVDDFSLTAVNRSVQARPFAERVQGVKLTLVDGAQRGRVGASLNDGVASANTPALERDVEFGLSARGEYVVWSDFAGGTPLSNFSDFLSVPGSGRGALVGGGVHYQKGESGTAALEDEVVAATLDATLKLDGVTVYGGGFHTDVSNGEDADATGFVILVTPVVFNDDIQLYGRYQHIRFDIRDIDSTVDITTIGFSRILGGGFMKVQGEVGYSSGIPVFGDIPLLGSFFRSDHRGTDRSELIIMVQAQISADFDW